MKWRSQKAKWLPNIAIVAQKVVEIKDKSNNLGLPRELSEIEKRGKQEKNESLDTKNELEKLGN